MTLPEPFSVEPFGDYLRELAIRLQRSEVVAFLREIISEEMYLREGSSAELSSYGERIGHIWLVDLPDHSSAVAFYCLFSRSGQPLGDFRKELSSQELNAFLQTYHLRLGEPRLVTPELVEEMANSAATAA